MKAAVIIILCLFALYGLICIIYKWSDLILNTSEESIGNPYLIMTVKNRQEDIEGVVRALAWQIISKKNDIAKELVIIDMGSKDDTLKILSRLESEYEFLHIMTKESYIDMWVKSC